MSEVGVTWMELFILFHMRGGDAIGRKSASKAHLRHTHAAMYRAFRRRSMALFACADEHTKPLLRAHLVRHAGNRLPLAHYGMRANFGQLPFKLSLGDSMLHAALCSYGGKVPSAARIPSRLRSGRFKPPRFAPWHHLANSSILPEAASRLLTKYKHEHQHLSQMPVHLFDCKEVTALSLVQRHERHAAENSL